MSQRPPLPELPNPKGAAKAAAATTLPPEIEQKFAAIRSAWKILGEKGKDDELEELHMRMEQSGLPIKARLFIIEAGVLSIENVSLKSVELIEKAMDGVNQEFSVSCIKKFVESCLGPYDYISIGHESNKITEPSSTSMPSSTNRTGPSANSEASPASQPPTMNYSAAGDKPPQTSPHQSKLTIPRSRGQSNSENTPVDKLPKKKGSFVKNFLYPEMSQKSKKHGTL